MLPFVFTLAPQVEKRNSLIDADFKTLAPVQFIKLHKGWARLWPVSGEGVVDLRLVLLNLNASDISAFVDRAQIARKQAGSVATKSHIPGNTLTLLITNV